QHLLADPDIEHEDARMRRLLRLRHAETKAKVDHGHALPAHVPQPEKIIGPVRDLESLLVVEDLPHDLDRYREYFAVEAEGDELGLGCVGHDHALSLKSASSASGPPIDMSRAKPRARACWAFTVFSILRVGA